MIPQDGTCCPVVVVWARVASVCGLNWPGVVGAVAVAGLVPLAGTLALVSQESVLMWAQTHVGASYQVRAVSEVIGLARFPAAEGGTCPLETRYACAKWAGLEQWDQDVPLWWPWELHNGPAWLAFSAAGGALAGLVVAGYVAGSAGRVRRYRFVAASVAVGAGAGVVLMGLGRGTFGEFVSAGPWSAAAVGVGGLTAGGFPRAVRVWGQGARLVPAEPAGRGVSGCRAGGER